MRRFGCFRCRKGKFFAAFFSLTQGMLQHIIALQFRLGLVSLEGRLNCRRASPKLGTRVGLIPIAVYRSCSSWTFTALTLSADSAHII